jgi:hypothetical protein
MNEELKLDQLTYTFDLLVLSTLDHLFFMLRIFIPVTKQATLMRRSTLLGPSTSAIVPWTR